MLYMPDIDGCYIKEFDAEVTKVGDDYIVLDQTAFYPEGGGQPSDQGTITKGDVEHEITMVVKKSGIVRHMVDEAKSKFEKGDKVNGKLDWELRHMHMRMHTAQHLLAAHMYEFYHARVVGNQIHADYSRIDFEPLDVDSGAAPAIVSEVNRILSAGLDVTVYEEDRAVLEEIYDMKRLNLDLIPESIKRLRVVDVEGLDVNPCAGTHVKNTSEIGLLRIIRVENKGKGKQRITYELLDNKK